MVMIVVRVGTARADTRAWKAAGKVLPAGLAWFGSLDAHALRSTKSLQFLWTHVLSTSPMARALDATTRDHCGGDLPSLVDSIALAGRDLAMEHVAVVVALDGIDRKGVASCLHAIADTAHWKLNVTDDGDVTVYDFGEAALTLRWLDDDVFAATTTSGREALDAMTAGGFAADKAMKRVMAGATTTAAAWAAVIVERDLPSLGTRMSRVYGQLALASSGFSIELRLQVRNAKEAAAAATKAARAFDDARQRFPAFAATIFGAQQARAKGDDLVIEAAFSDDDLATALSKFASP